MKKLSIFFLALIGNYSIISAQSTFFEKSKLIETGVYYYPEAWPENQWERDFSNMAKMGFEFTHLAEFSWAQLEPVEGKYNFQWLDKAINLAAKYKLKVILCTPTPTPPLWLTKKYPEILLEKNDGLKLDHGGRQHYSWSSDKYRELCEKIIVQMATRYGNDKRIWGWQINNEPGHYGPDDHGEQVRLKFIEWLKVKYVSLDALNKAWGTSFWSLVIDKWENVFIPNILTNNNGINPHAVLDFKRFSAWNCSDFVKFEADILKKYVAKSQFVTTNFIHFFDDIDPWLSDKHLDFISYTMYPVGGGYSNNWGLGDQAFRVGIPNRISWANDFFRYKKGYTGVMELQPGQVNWGLYNPIPMPGMIRGWLWNSYAGGSEFACTYRYRQPLYGSEQYHHGIVGPDGITPSVGGEEYMQFMKEIKQLREKYKSDAKPPQDWLNRKTAILWNFDNFWNTQSHPQTNQWDSDKIMFKYHEAVKTVGTAVDYIDEQADFNQYKVMVAPMYQLVDQKLLEKWKDFVNKGGHLILSSRVAQKDKNGHLWEMPYGNFIRELTNSKLKFYDVLPDNKQASVNFGGNLYKWNNWADVWVAGEGVEVWATYADQFYKDQAAVIHRKLGKGSVTVIGPDTDDGEMEKKIIRQVYEASSLKPMNLPSGIMLDYRDGFFIAVNYHSTDSLEVPLPAGTEILFGNKLIKPGDVLVWRATEFTR